MKITFAKISAKTGLPNTGVVAAGVLEGRKLTAGAKLLDHAMMGGLMRAIKSTRFKGAKAQALDLLTPAGTKLDRAYLIGLGKAPQINALALQAAGGRLYSALAAKGVATVSVLVDAVAGCKMSAAEMAVAMAEGARLAAYRFDKYRTKEKKEDKPSLKTMKFLLAAPEKARAAFAPREKVCEGVFLTRDMVSEPANILYPETMANHARKLAKLGVKVDVLGRGQMKRLGMGALLGVAQGSAREPKLVVMRWNGAPKKAPKTAAASAKSKAAIAPIVFVGKGVTFDTGGISIKPSGGMEDMKYDMAGAGVVIGLMKALAGRKAKVNAVGIVGLVENMPSGTAQRPGDVVESMSKQTIEVINTDAEGRLVLADALWYAKEKFKPRMMVNLATLTGAIIICLGNEKAGLFSNNDALAKRLAEAGDKVGEKLWRLPLGEEYDKMLKSDIADMKNISGGRGAGSITAAQFLKRFVEKTPWAHLDIAGVAWCSKGKATTPKGAAGFGVRLLDRLVADHYESK